MKNDTVLAVLQQQHQHDLQTCSQLKQQMSKQQDRKQVKEALLQFWKNNLQKHIEAEETTLLPFLAKQQFSQQYIGVLKRDHDTLRAVAQRLTTDQTTRNLYELFIHLVEQHISFEDNVVLQKMQHEIPPHELSQLRYSA